MNGNRKVITIQQKLMLLTTFPAIVVTAVVFSIFMSKDLTRLQSELVDDARAHIEYLSQDFSRIIGGDIDLPANISRRLQNYKVIESIRLSDTSDNTVFQYDKTDRKKIAVAEYNQQYNQQNIQFSAQSLTLFEPVVFQEVLYGEVALQVSTKKIQELRNNYLQRGLIFTLFCLSFFVFLFWRIGRYYVRPVQQLAEALNHLGEKHDFSAQLPVKRDDEIGQLFAGFNFMQQQLEHADKKLQDQRRALDKHSLVTISDAQGVIIYANKKFTELSGYSQAELLGENHRIVKSGVHNDGFYQQMYQAINSGQVWQGELCNRAKDGSLYWANTTIMPLMNEHGKPEQFIAIRTDITRQKMMVKAQQISEQRLEMAMSVANDGIWDWHLDDDSVYFDERYFTMAGYQPFAFAGEFEQFQQRVHPDHIKALLAAIRQYIEGRSTSFDVEFKYKKEAGDYMWIRGRGKIVERDTSNKPLRFVGTHSDVTLRKRTEQQLIKSERRYRQIFESSQAVKLIVGKKEGRIIEANKAAVSFYGYDIATLTSMSISDIDVLSAKEAKQKVYENKAKKGERLVCRHQLASGEVRDVEVYSGTVKIGKKAYLYLIVQDVSERMMAEGQLRRAQKMDAVGQLTGGIAHDFNNILGIVSGNITLLDRHLQSQQKLDEKSQKRIDTIKHSTQRAIELTRKLLDFSRDEVASEKTVDINQLIMGMHSLVEHSLTPQVEVKHKLAENLWLVAINPGDFEDALLNLLLNARDAMSGSGRIVIESRNVLLDKDVFTYNPEIPSGEYIELSVSDNGEGMSLEQQEHIFEPFYTTKKQGKGTGLGLSMVFGFVKRSGGSIKVYSEPGIGTTFRLFLPRELVPIDTLPRDHVEQKSEALPRGSETILVVDDEAALLELVQESLRSLGYRVLSASDGEQALQRLSEGHDGEKSAVDSSPVIDLLFSDVVMPGINGFELAEQAHRLYPALKILLTSGYTEKAMASNKPLPFVTKLLAKPYNQRDLAQRLRQLLDVKVSNDL